MTDLSRPAERGAGTVAVLLITAGIVVTLALVISGLSALHVRTARLGWAETLGTKDELMHRFPATAANDSALELERLAATLGVNVTPRHVDRYEQLQSDRQRPGPAFARLKKEVFGVYAKRQLEQAHRGAIDAPPAPLAEFMSDHAEELAGLRRHLTSAPTPVWESDLSRMWEAPIPNLLGHLDLTKLLTNVAVARLHEGDVERALENVEASVALTRTLRDQPYLISQLVAIAEARMQVGVLRHVPDLPQAWIDRIEEHDYRASFLTAMKFEGWVWAYADDEMVTGTDPSWLSRATSVATRSYTKLCLADLSLAWKERLVNLEQVGSLCDYDLASDNASLDIPIPRWNVVGGWVVPNLLDATDRLARLELDIELTRLVSEADAERRADPQAWQASLGTSRASTACSEDQWFYSSTADGLQIEFSRDIAWPGQQDAILPTRALLE